MSIVNKDWVVHKSPFEVFNVDHGRLIYEVVSGETLIAALYDDEDSYSARLIASAPDLLEALKYARRFLKSIDHDVDFVDAAIAKAEGRS